MDYNTQIKNQPSVDCTSANSIPTLAGCNAFPVELYGAKADFNGSSGTDNTTAFQNAINSIKNTHSSGDAFTANGKIPCIKVGPGSYQIKGTIDMTDFEYNGFCGVRQQVSFIICNQTSGVPCFKLATSTTRGRYGNVFKDLTIAIISTSTTAGIDATAQLRLVIIDCTFISNISNTSNNLVKLTNVEESFIQRNAFYGAVNTGDSLYVFATPISTTINVSDNIFDGANTNKACARFDGGSGAANIQFINNTVQNCGTLLQVGTEVWHAGNHYEASSITKHAIYAPTSAELLSGGGNTWQIGGTSLTTSYFDITGGGDYTVDASDLFPSFSAGQTIFNTSSSGAKLHMFNNPLNADNEVIVAGPGVLDTQVLAKKAFALTGGSGAVTYQLWRGNTLQLEVSGATTVHIRGGDNGTMNNTPIGLGAGEKIYLLLTNDNASDVGTADGSDGDFTIVGSICKYGLAGSTYQNVELTSDGANKLYVTQSSCWQPLTLGSSFPKNYNPCTSFTPAVTFGNASVGITYASNFGESCLGANSVKVYIAFTLSSKGSSTGQMRVGGFPIAVGNAAGSSGYCGSYGGFSGLASSPIISGGNGVNAFTVGQFASTTVIAVADTHATNSSNLVCTFEYHP